MLEAVLFEQKLLERRGRRLTKGEANGGFALPFLQESKKIDLLEVEGRDVVCVCIYKKGEA